jgi:hypothetical protein
MPHTCTDIYGCGVVIDSPPAVTYSSDCYSRVGGSAGRSDGQGISGVFHTETDEYQDDRQIPSG